MELFDKICIDVIKSCAETVYIYPFGKIGFQIKHFLKDKYCIHANIICIDSNVSKYSDEVYDLEILSGVNWENEKAVIILASENPELYYELRLKLYELTPSKYIVDYCPVNPLCYDTNPRVAALAISAEEIYRNGVNGSVAEAGVYRGEFARYINMLFPDRKLYLFDSFEGFSKQSFDLGQDNYEQVKNWDGYKADTSVETVLTKLQYPKKAIIRKGYVPQTLEGVEDRFCFVNLDMDLYMPTYEALGFFWERMNPGGYIFVHDVNNWDGCGKAVRDFCEKYDTGYICLNDRITAAILKPFKRKTDGLSDNIYRLGRLY